MDDDIRNPQDAHAAARQAADPDRPSANPAVGASVGGTAGALAGAAAGTLTAGPIGTIVGAIIGAVGGGWAGLAVAQDARPSDADEEFYRTHYRGATASLADASYDRARPAYHLGHVAAHNPDYYGRGFDEVERDLQHGWQDDVRTRHGEWASVREYARAGYERAGVHVRDRMQGAARIAGTAAHTGSADTTGRAEFNDRMAPDAPAAGNMSGAVGDPGTPRESRDR